MRVSQNDPKTKSTTDGESKFAFVQNPKIREFGEFRLPIKGVHQAHAWPFAQIEMGAHVTVKPMREPRRAVLRAGQNIDPFPFGHVTQP